MLANIKQIIEQATEAANKAGDEWLEAAVKAGPRFSTHNTGLFGKPTKENMVGTMLDNCGNAHVQFKDKRSAIYKQFKKEGFIRGTDNGVINIPHKWKPRQEYGLAIACVTAAKKVLEENGVDGLRIWDYID